MSGVSVIELGCPGHFICADRCNYRRHTQIGDSFRVSTVGDLYIDGKRTTVGSWGYFETMVFPTLPKMDAENDGCGCREVADFGGLECERYDTAGEAHAGHEKLVSKYIAKAEETNGPSQD